jgi:hypothetical protein
MLVLEDVAGDIDRPGLVETLVGSRGGEVADFMSASSTKKKGSRPTHSRRFAAMTLTRPHSLLPPWTTARALPTRARPRGRRALLRSIRNDGVVDELVEKELLLCAKRVWGACCDVSGRRGVGCCEKRWRCCWAGRDSLK